MGHDSNVQPSGLESDALPIELPTISVYGCKGSNLDFLVQSQASYRLDDSRIRRSVQGARVELAPPGYEPGDLPIVLPRTERPSLNVKVQLVDLSGIEPPSEPCRPRDSTEHIPR